MKRIAAGTLDVAYFEAGPSDGSPVLLLHGFPYDAHAFGAVMPRLAAAGRRCIAPFLRGHGPTQFRETATPRSGQQAALATDLLALLDALELPSAVLAGYDWGGRAACAVAALWPDRVRGLVSGCGYTVQDIAAAMVPQAPEEEHQFWYQYYFHSVRGEAGLAANRRALCRLLWRLWSPDRKFDDTAFDRTAAAFDNPDWVAVVIHSYRHRFGLVAGDPALDDVERRLAACPPISVPSIVLHGAKDGVAPLSGSVDHAQHFVGFYERRFLPGIGHNLPQEAPEVFVEAVLAVGE